MPVESLAVSGVTETAKAVETGIREIWNKLDAASEKPRPSEYLGQKAVSAIQGVATSAPEKPAS